MNLINVIKYICKNLGDDGAIASTRLARVLYLIDWKSSLELRQQLTPISWCAKKGILWASGLTQEVENAEDLTFAELTSNNDEEYKAVKLLSSIEDVNWNEEGIDFIKDLILSLKNLSHADLYELVYSTYPLMVTPDEQEIDFVRCAEEYSGTEKAA